MDPLAKLFAIEQIKQLKARYFRCMDTKDWAGLSTVFTPDATFDLRAVNSVRDPLTGALEPPISQCDADVYRGRDAVLAMIRGAVETLVTVHHGHMPEIEITSPTTATGVWAMEDVIRNAPDAPPLSVDGYGHYHETYELIDEHWAIKTTRITRLHIRRG